MEREIINKPSAMKQIIIEEIRASGRRFLEQRFNDQLNTDADRWILIQVAKDLGYPEVAQSFTEQMKD